MIGQPEQMIDVVLIEEDNMLSDLEDIYPSDIPRQALLEHQVELEQLFSKNQTIDRIRQEFVECPDVDFEASFAAAGVDPEFGLDLMVQMVLHKRTTLPTMVGILRRHFDDLPNASQLAADEILKLVEAGFVEWRPTARQLVVVVNISQDVQDDLDRFQYPLPMVVRPRQVRENMDTGYLTPACARGSVILRRNHHEEDVCLDHLNRANRVRFTINHDVAAMVKNRWRDLDRPKEGESKEDFQKRCRAFDKYDRTARDVMSVLLAHGNEFYLTHRYDKRGRVYCQGYHVNYQGAPWNKAVIELADKEIVP